MNATITRTVVAAVAAGLCSPAAIAVEALTAAELARHCAAFESDPDSADAVFCVRYIQGFIDGAVATDAQVTRNVAEDIGEDESFRERVMRTRLGPRLERYGPSYYAEFCLGDPVPLERVVRDVIEGLNARDVAEMQPLARDVVYRTLRRRYPCSEGEP